MTLSWADLELDAGAPAVAIVTQPQVNPDR